MNKLILLFTLLAFMGCKEAQSQKVINWDDIKEVDGIWYLKHDASLLTGMVKELDENGAAIA